LVILRKLFDQTVEVDTFKKEPIKGIAKEIPSREKHLKALINHPGIDGEQRMPSSEESIHRTECTDVVGYPSTAFIPRRSYKTIPWSFRIRHQ